MKIAILIYPKFTVLDATGPFEMLAHTPGVDVKFVAKEKGTITSETGFLKVEATADFTEVQTADVLVVPGAADVTAAAADPDTLNWIRKIHKTTQFTTSVCTGSLILGAAGILKNLKATTHWAAKEELEKTGATYQAARWVEEGKIITAAGVSAGIDMALYLLSKLANKDTAMIVQLATEYDPAPPFTSGSPKTAPSHILDISTALFNARTEGYRYDDYHS